MQQNKNLILFIVLAMVIFLGWSWVQMKIWPPKPRPPQLSAQELGDLRTAMGAVGLLPGGPLNAGSLAAVVLAGDQAGKQLGRQVAAREEKPKPKPEPRKVEPAKSPEDIVLGDEDWNIKVTLTTRGAGVKRLVLNKFQQADLQGRPVWKDPDTKKEPEPLELFNNTGPNDFPSYLLLHYKSPALDEDERPLATLGHMVWDASAKEKGKVVFRTEAIPDFPGVSITKTYTLEPGDYHLGLEVRVRHEGASKIKFRYQFASPHNVHLEGIWFASMFRKSMIGLVDAKGNVKPSLEEGKRIGFRSGGDVVNRSEEKGIGYAGVAVQHFACMVVVDREENAPLPRYLARARPTLEAAAIKGRVGPVAPDKRTFELRGDDKAKYTLVAANDVDLPDEGQEIKVVWMSGEDDQMVATEILKGDNVNQIIPEDIAVRVTTEPIALDEPGAEVVHKYLLYNGPVKVALLGQLSGDKAVPDTLVDHYKDDLHLDSLTDYGNWGFWTQLLDLCKNLMHRLLWFLHTYVMPWSYGLCIVLLTVLVRGMMFPISRKQALTSIRMQQVGPELKKLQAKYKDDRQAMGMAQMELYRKHGINPLGGCLVVVLQMPIFLGLYYALQESIMFRLAPFLGWIQNLAAPDMLFHWGDRIPLISEPMNFLGLVTLGPILGPYFNLLPMIAVGLMIFQQSKMTPPPTDEQQAMQQKMMKYMMIVFGLMFYKVAAGLCIYFVASSVWGLTERKLLPKRQTAPPGTFPEPAKNGLLQRVLARLEERRQPAAAAAAVDGAGVVRQNAAASQLGATGTTSSRSKRRQERKKRMQGREKGLPPSGPATPVAGSDGNRSDQPLSLMQRLRAWWADVLEQAKKK